LKIKGDMYGIQIFGKGGGILPGSGGIPAKGATP
jgi:hypothetical protein